jgi:hypothetical protein
VCFSNDVYCLGNTITLQPSVPSIPYRLYIYIVEIVGILLVEESVALLPQALSGGSQANSAKKQYCSNPAGTILYNT